MSRAASFEFFLICLVGVLCFLVISSWPDSISIGRFVLSLSVLFLVQTLLRDLWLLVQQKSGRQPEGKQEKPVFCVESVVGISAVIIGCCLLFIAVPTTVYLNAMEWSIAVFLTMLLCFMLKDYVFEWRPWRVYKESGHVNIIVRWR